jgi:serine/threonine protein kinase
MKEQHGPIHEQHHEQEYPANAMPRRRFGNYDLIRHIDIGGMGEVYLARQRTAFGREVAIKIMRSDLVHDAVARRRFLREAEVTAHLLHEHILPLIEFSDEGGRLFLVTPYIKGGTLATRLEHGSLAYAEIEQLFTALVQAVAYIHRRGVIHRDLKPSNILLDSEEGGDAIYVRLIDFGIASVSGEQATSAPLTSSGHEVGTAAYMAPERLEGIVAPSNDIYSLGIILYEMLTGELPTQLGRVRTVPSVFSAIIKRCVTTRPDGRFASADALLDAFQQAYESWSRGPQVQQRLASEGAVPPLVERVERGKRGERVQEGPPAEQPVQIKRSASLNDVKVHRAELVLPSMPDQSSHFQREDYSATTTYVKPEDLARLQSTNELAIAAPAIPPKLSKSKPRKRSLLGIVTIAIVALLAIIGGMGYMAVQAAISTDVVVSPRVQKVSKVLSMSALPTIHNVDANTASLPANVLSNTQTGSVTGPTSGQSACVLGIFDCHQAVSLADIAALAGQERPALRTQLAQNLQQQARTSSCTTVGKINYTDGNVDSNPQLGSASKTVTVTLTEQGSVECIKTQDVHTLALAMFQQQAPQNYALLNSQTQIGKSVVRSIDDAGVVKLAVPIAGVAQYQIPGDELARIQMHISGMKLQAARAYIATMPGLDNNATTMRISMGDTVPSNVGQIHVTTANPATLPTVTVPKVPKVS